jgi:SSS family transporter
MSASVLVLILGVYLLVLIGVSRVTAGSGNRSFFNADRKSPWYLVAFGMIGASLSGVTFISVPGLVGKSGFHYLQFVMGNVVGYWLIALVLIPLYYRKNVLSIYSILHERFGRAGHLTASAFFILSKLISAAFRMYLAATVIYLVVAQGFPVSFEFTVLLFLAAIWLYTYKGGIKTIVWTDTIQTVVLLAAVFFALWGMMSQLKMNVGETFQMLIDSNYVRIFNFDFNSDSNFFKQFISGIVVTLAINGFDQDIVQKNLTCRNAQQARKNMLWFSLWFLVSVGLFLILGALMYEYAQKLGIQLPTKSDEVFPFLALSTLGPVVALMFVLGISAAAFSSADSATTSLTTAFCVDFLKDESRAKPLKSSTRNWVHLSFSVVIFLIIISFRHLNDQSVVESIFKAAGYTYGPILGLFVFAFGFRNRIVPASAILPIAVLAPMLTWAITWVASIWAPSYQFGFELIVVNTAIMLAMLISVSKRRSKVKIL